MKTAEEYARINQELWDQNAQLREELSRVKRISNERAKKLGLAEATLDSESGDDQTIAQLRKELETVKAAFDDRVRVIEMQSADKEQLRKEIEELRRHNTEQASIKHDLRVEITRLTELLRRAYPFTEHELRKEIENAIGHEKR